VEWGIKSDELSNPHEANSAICNFICQLADRQVVKGKLPCLLFSTKKLPKHKAQNEINE
jgi:hypothetical protein